MDAPLHVVKLDDHNDEHWVFVYEDRTVHRIANTVDEESAAWLRANIFGGDTENVVSIFDSDPDQFTTLFHYFFILGDGLLVEVIAYADPEFGPDEGLPYGENPYEDDPYAEGVHESEPSRECLGVRD